MYSALTETVYGLKTDTLLNNETSEIKRDMCAFGSTYGGGSYLIDLVLLSTIF